MSQQSASQIGVALRVIHELTEMNRGPFSEPPFSPGVRLADHSYEATRDRSRKAAALLEKLQTVDDSIFPDELALTLRLARFDLKWKAREADWYWHVFSPVRVYAMFAATSYCGGAALNRLGNSLAAFAFERESDRDRYLGHVSDTARLIDQFAERTVGQGERKIVMPRQQLENAGPLLDSILRMFQRRLPVDESRLGRFSSSAFARETASRVNDEIAPAIARFKALLLDADYRNNAPETVGLSQYPGGAEIYAELVQFCTTMEITAAEVHERGLERMKSVRHGMARARDAAGFQGTDKEYLSALNTDPAWRAETAAEIEAAFRRYMDRMKPRLAEFFDFQSPTPCAVSPLPAVLEPSMTFGYYDMPRKSKARGEYFYNTANMTSNNIINVAALNYHELEPGHHLHFSNQLTNETVHPLHNFAFYNAFNEGWAEYAAALAGEAHMYAEPGEMFGRLVMEAFLTSRLVVDTGMNIFGWSLEKARDYMRENSFLSENEICSESLRYSCDTPAQALAYKLGDAEIMRLREKMHEELGERFDIRDFHRAMLHPGGMPLSDLEWHVGRTMRKNAGRTK